MVSKFGSSNSDTIDGTPTSDLLYGWDQASGESASDGDDRLNGLAGDDFLSGGGGNDLLDGGVGSDRMAGGIGHDTYFVDAYFAEGANSDIVVEAVGNGFDRIVTTSSFRLQAGVSVELITAREMEPSLANNSTIVGNELDQRIEGNSIYNSLSGGGGNDVLAGGKSSDDYHVDSMSDRVIELAGEGENDTIFTSANYRLEANSFVETIVAESDAGGLSLTGNGVSQEIRGNDADNVIDGGGGGDLMIGGGGNDTYHVRNVDDRVQESDPDGFELVIAWVTYTLGENLENLALAEDSPINAGGNELDNVLKGNSADNRLDGKAGYDAMIGLGGNDIYYVDNAGDQVFEGAGQGKADWVATRAGYVLDVGSDIEKFSTTNAGSATAIDLVGNEFGQLVGGNAGANIISGKAGNDTLAGAGGADIFVFDTELDSSLNVDRVADFNVADDTIWLDNAIFAQVAGIGGLYASQFAKNDSGLAGDGSDRVIYETDTGKMFYDSNGRAPGGAIQFAALTPNLSLTNWDFQIV